MRVAVVGHVEWVQFATVERVPAPGEIVRAREQWFEAAGGGTVSAARLRDLAGTCDFFTALGGDEAGGLARAAVGALGLHVHAATRDEPQRRAFTYLSADAERTITLLGAKLHPLGADPLPWDALADADAVYFCAGDAAALRAARRAGALVATARELPTLIAAGVPLDALVHSASDPAEAYEAGRLDPAPRLVVTTRGRAGGSWAADGKRGTYEVAEPQGAIRDAYGAGDAFAAGLAFALGRGDGVEDAIACAARSAADALTIKGAHGRG